MIDALENTHFPTSLLLHLLITMARRVLVVILPALLAGAASAFTASSSLSPSLSSRLLQGRRLATSSTSSRRGAVVPTTTTTMMEAKPTGSAPLLSRAYGALGVGSAVSWAACAGYALSRHPTLALPARHNALTIAQALAFPVPLTLAVAGALSAAAAHEEGWSRLAGPTYRRLNLGLAAASCWLAAAAFNQAAFVPKSLVAYPAPLKLAAVACHSVTALLCLGTWMRSVSGNDYIGRVMRGKEAGRKE